MLIVIAGISQGFANAIRKHLAISKIRATTIASAIMLLNSIFCFPFMLLDFRITHDVGVWIFTIGSVIAFALSLSFLIKSYQKLDLSTATIIHRSDVLFIAAFGVLILSEQLNTHQIIAIIMLFFSILVVMYENHRFIFLGIPHMQ